MVQWVSLVHKAHVEPLDQQDQREPMGHRLASTWR